MFRRDFLLSSGAAFAANPDADPQYRIVTRYKTSPRWNLPGQVVRVKAAKSIDESTETVNAEVVAAMMAQGMTRLTGDKDPRDSWRKLFNSSDEVGIKVNASGAPKIMSHPVVVAEIVKRLVEAGVKQSNITVYERFPSQLETVDYEKHTGVRVLGAEPYRGRLTEYDPNTYVEVNFFGEDDTRSSMVRAVSERFTKIINVPNMKDHGASGVTGCLKNIAYGSFHNVARSHAFRKTHTKTFIGTLASVEPLRSKVVLHVMDGLKGIWHGGPFQLEERFKFFPKQMMFGTDPVAIDRVMRDVIEDKRKMEGAISVLDRSVPKNDGGRSRDPNKNPFIREPLHIEYAASLGLGVVDLAKIKVEEISL